MIEIKQSKIGRYKLLIDGEKKYLLDIDYSDPISMLVKSPVDYTFKGALIDDTTYQLMESSIKGSFGILPAVLITQPIVALLYSVGNNILNSLKGNFLFEFKILSIIFTICISLLIKLVVSWNDQRIIKKYIKNNQRVFVEISQEENDYHKNKSFLRDSWLLILITSILPLFLYFNIQNGTESGFYFIFSISFLGFLFMSRYVIQSSIYKNSIVNIK